MTDSTPTPPPGQDPRTPSPGEGSTSPAEPSPGSSAGSSAGGWPPYPGPPQGPGDSGQGGQAWGGQPPSGPGYGGQGYGSQVGQGYGPAPVGVGYPADLGTRFLARFIDYLILAAVYVVLAVIFRVGSLTTSSLGANLGLNAVLAVLLTVIYLAYFTLLESRTGQTVGKLALRLQTQAPDGSTPTLEQALRRNLFNATWILGVLPFLGLVGNLLWLAACIAIAVTVSGSPVRAGWHDRFAGGTRVIKIG